MVEIGGKPMLWHIMKLYAAHGINEFIICCGHKGYLIKEYFANYRLHMSDVSFDLSSGEVTLHHQRVEPWKVTLVDTGEDTMTGGRLRRVAEHVRGEELFCLTYGDGVGDIDISASVRFHRDHGRLATVTAVTPPARFGALQCEGDQVRAFSEKVHARESLINGGFFVLSPRVLDFIADDASIWEKEPLSRIAEAGELMAFRHPGFWQPMDTLRERQLLEELWASGEAPWKIWS